MKRFLTSSLLIATALLCGCSLELIPRLRNQLKEPDRFFAVTCDQDTFTIRFLEPVVRRSSLGDLGLPDCDPAKDDVQISYVLQLNEFQPREVDLRLHFARDRLQSVDMPPILASILGRTNILAIMRLAGGTNEIDESLEQIPTQRIHDLFKAEGAGYDPDAKSVRIKLAPVVAHTRSLVIQLSHDAPNEGYNTINLRLKMEPNSARLAR